MFYRFRVSAAVYRITNQRASSRHLQGNRDCKVFASNMHDRIMTKYCLEAHRGLKSRSIHSIALSLATGALMELEESLAEDRDIYVMVEIQALRDCMVAFGEMYGRQSMVSAYLAKYEETRAALGT